MKNLIYILAFVVSSYGYAQTFTNSPGLAVPNLTTVTSNITVSGVGPLGCAYGLVSVCIDITHTRTADMDIFLIDPSGNSYELTTDNGGGGNHFDGTCFDMDAATAITAGSAPFSGSYRPEGNINLINDGQNGNGVWTLQVRDDRSGQSGTLNSWTLNFDVNPPCDSDEFTTSPGTFITSGSPINSNQTVSGVGVIGCSYGLFEVCVDIDHTFDADLDLRLTDPSGAVYELSTDNGGGGNNYSVTCFSMSAATLVTAGSAPFNGDFQPEGDISAANNGQNANGTWTLNVTDDSGGDNGTLNDWSLVFGPNPECPPVTSEDCSGGLTLCSDATFTGNSSGSGNITDLTAANDGCLGGENESSWYYFQAASSGTYAFEIVTLVDYDFAVWGPLDGIYCPPQDPPLRCSYSGTPGRTGLAAGAGDTSEGGGGDAFVDPIVASVGEIFIIAIDNFTADGTSFDLDFTLSGGATLDCTPLPIQLLSFTGNTINNVNSLEWVTASELNNAYFTIEQSVDGLNWQVLDNVEGAGTSSLENNYSYRHFNFEETVNYYRLSQTDYDEKFTHVSTISLNNEFQKEVVKRVNLLGQEVDEYYQGVQILVFADGTTKKVLSLNQ